MSTRSRIAAVAFVLGGMFGLSSVPAHAIPTGVTCTVQDPSVDADGTDVQASREGDTTTVSADADADVNPAKVKCNPNK